METIRTKAMHDTWKRLGSWWVRDSPFAFTLFHRKMAISAELHAQHRHPNDAISFLS